MYAKAAPSLIMAPLPAILTLFLFNAVTAFAFALFFLGGPLNRRVPALAFLFVLISLALGITGWLAGDAIAERLGNFSQTAGGILALVAGLKRIVKGWRTKVSERFYDITRPRTLPALILAVNLDTLLMGVAISMISSMQLENGMTWLVVSAASGILLARMVQKRTPLIIANAAEIMAGIVLMLAGAFAMF